MRAHHFLHTDIIFYSKPLFSRQQLKSACTIYRTNHPFWSVRLNGLSGWGFTGKTAGWWKLDQFSAVHYDDVIMTTMAAQITSLTVVYPTVYSDANQRKHQSSASLAFVWGIHRDRRIPRTKVQLRGKCFHLMTSSWLYSSAFCRIHQITFYQLHFTFTFDRSKCISNDTVLLLRNRIMISFVRWIWQWSNHFLLAEYHVQFWHIELREQRWSFWS